MIKLSVIIVNYNVKFFLEQALLSVRKASRNLAVEVFVVDNHSVDGSVQMVKEKFAEVILIENKDNTGFAKANNQAIRLAKGEYILLLNPDTVVEEDTFEKCVAFMDAHADAGALGVKMLDGSGNFLPESKRGFPTPMVAFFKAFGFTKFFPKSKTFARYYLGNLSSDENNEVEVLAGAFMLLRKKVLDEIGLLDETFFMYGEDIDLSYRVIQAGHKNYYLADTRIIHYKGESTKKGSLNYVRMFYMAMIIFARKHFSQGSASGLILMLNVAIYFRAALALINRFLNAIAAPAFDAIGLYAAMLFFKNLWETKVKATEGVSYPPEYIFIIVPAYIAVWLLSVFFSGGYDRNSKPGKIIRGLVIGTLIIAAVYGFLDESLRFSRGMILLGFVFGVFFLAGWRFIRHYLRFGNFGWGEEFQRKIVIAGSYVEGKRVYQLLNNARINFQHLGFVLPDAESYPNELREEERLGHLNQLTDLVELYRPDEIIFCSKDISSQQIISQMAAIGSKVDYKIVPEESLSVIGSGSKDTNGELYTIDISMEIDLPNNRRNKRLLDVMVSFFLLITLPVQILLMKNFIGLIGNLFSVLFGKKTWVGYSGEQFSSLPKIKKGVLNSSDVLSKVPSADALNRLNLLYARNYTSANDLEIILKAFRNLGR